MNTLLPATRRVVHLASFEAAPRVEVPTDGPHELPAEGDDVIPSRTQTKKVAPPAPVIKEEDEPDPSASISDKPHDAVADVAAPPRCPPPPPPTQKCIQASACPASHPHAMECVEKSKESSCSVLEISSGASTALLGVAGNFRTVHDAFESQKTTFTPHKVTFGASLKTRSHVIAVVPHRQQLPVILGVKVVEAMALGFLLFQSKAGRALKVVCMLYYTSMLHYHVMQMLDRKKIPAEDAVYEKVGMKSIERMELISSGRLLATHDGDRQTEIKVRLVPTMSSRCDFAPHACEKRRCCTSADVAPPEEEEDAAPMWW